MKLTAALLICLVVGLAPVAEGARARKKAPPGVSFKKFARPAGSFRLGYFQRDRTFDDETDHLVTSTWVTIKTKRIYNIGFFLDGNIQAKETHRSNDIHGDLREIYSFGNLNGFDLKLGRQIIVWGRADKVNPTDSLSLKDLTLLATDDEDQRTGLFTAQQTYNFGDYRIIGIWQPEWRDPKVPIPSLPSGLTLTSLRPDNAARQFALKFDRTGGSFDYSVSYFNGIDKTPDLQFGPGAPLDVQLAYNPIQVFGVDTAFNLGDVAARAELAYTRTRDSDGSSPTIKNSFLFAVLGAERLFFEALNINLQYMARYHQDWSSPYTIPNPFTRLLNEQAQVLVNQDREFKQGLTLRLSHTSFSQTLVSEMVLLSWLESGDYLLRPKLTYSINDSWTIIGGGEMFGGPDQSYFGRLRGFSTAFGELRYFF